jgi:hypothetical protein
MDLPEEEDDFWALSWINLSRVDVEQSNPEVIRRKLQTRSEWEAIRSYRLRVIALSLDQSFNGSLGKY